MNGMTPIEFARRHFGEFTEKGNEIVPKLCPYCHGGSSHDKHSFAMNIETGVFNCKRGSCGVSGTFYKLKIDFGETDKMSNYEYHNKPSKKVFTPSTAQLKPSGSKVIDYLALRKISKETADKYLIGDDGKGNICFPYMKNGERVAVKYRPARKIEKGEKKQWRETGTDTTTLFGMQHVDASCHVLYITEGEIDCLSLAEVGVPNAVSVPNGAEDLNWIESNWDFLEQFKSIVLCGDSDAPGREMVREVIQRLGQHRCSVVTLPDDCKDANEVLYKHGTDALMTSVSSAKEIPVAGLLRLADVESIDLSKTERFRTGIYDLDRATGGCFMGQTSVFTGINGSGKSTLLGQLMLEAIEQDFSVCAFSGELPAPLFRYWIDLQAAGAECISLRHDTFFDENKPYVSKENAVKIRKWYEDKFFLYDNTTAITPENVFSVFEYSAQRYNCRIFLIDNLMLLVGGAGDDYYRRQSDFIKQCTAFAKRFNVHVFVVAHPRKTTGRLSKLDIAGSGDITNLADNVFSVYRLTAEEKKAEGVEGDAVLDVFKSRFSGQQDCHIGLCFDENSKRFYQASKTTLRDRVYGWRRLNDGLYDMPSDTTIPF